MDKLNSIKEKTGNAFKKAGGAIKGIGKKKKTDEVNTSAENEKVDVNVTEKTVAPKKPKKEKGNSGAAIKESFGKVGGAIKDFGGKIADVTHISDLTGKGGKLDYHTTVEIDTRRSTIHSFTMVGNDVSTVRHHIKSYTGAHFDDAFFARFKEIMTEFAADAPSESVRKITVIIPDNAVALDTVNVPTMRSKGAIKNALNITLGEIYKNYPDLKIQSHVSAQNRQYTTFSTAAVQKRILTAINSSCSENKLLAQDITYASAAAVSGALTLNPKLKGASYLLLDVKDTYSRFVFVVGGRAVGFYTLPFGLEFLSTPKYVQEDMLFNHTMAELTVLNAREKAKAKRLTVLAADEPEIIEPMPADAETAEIATDADPDPDDVAIEAEINAAEAENEEAKAVAEAEAAENAEEEAEEEFEDGKDITAEIAEQFAMTVGHRIATPKYMPKKTPRKLPKFMQRPVPETEEEIACENFRVFIKWALTLVANNEKITDIGAPEFVCVNIPENLSFLLDYANAEKEENKLEFRRIRESAIDPSVGANLELYGGFFPKNIHISNKF